MELFQDGRSRSHDVGFPSKVDIDYCHDKAHYTLLYLLSLLPAHFHSLRPNNSANTPSQSPAPNLNARLLKDLEILNLLTVLFISSPKHEVVCTAFRYPKSGHIQLLICKTGMTEKDLRHIEALHKVVPKKHTSSKEFLAKAYKVLLPYVRPRLMESIEKKLRVQVERNRGLLDMLWDSPEVAGLDTKDSTERKLEGLGCTASKSTIDKSILAQMRATGRSAGGLMKSKYIEMLQLLDMRTLSTRELGDLIACCDLFGRSRIFEYMLECTSMEREARDSLRMAFLEVGQYREALETIYKCRKYKLRYRIIREDRSPRCVPLAGDGWYEVVEKALKGRRKIDVTPRWISTKRELIRVCPEWDCIPRTVELHGHCEVVMAEHLRRKRTRIAALGLSRTACFQGVSSLRELNKQWGTAMITSEGLGKTHMGLLPNNTRARDAVKSVVEEKFHTILKEIQSNI